MLLLSSSSVLPTGCVFRVLTSYCTVAYTDTFATPKLERTCYYFKSASKCLPKRERWLVIKLLPSDTHLSRAHVQVSKLKSSSSAASYGTQITNI